MIQISDSGAAGFASIIKLFCFLRISGVIAPVLASLVSTSIFVRRLELPRNSLLRP